MLKYTSLVLAAAACACFVDGLREIDPADLRVVPNRLREATRLCHGEVIQACRPAAFWNISGPADVPEALNVGDTSNANFHTVRAQIATTQDHPEYRAALRGLSRAELTEAFRLATVQPSAVDDISNANLPTVHAQIATAQDHATYRADLNDLTQEELAEAFRLAPGSAVDAISNVQLPAVHEQIATAKEHAGYRAALHGLSRAELTEAFRLADVHESAVDDISNANLPTVHAQIALSAIC